MARRATLIATLTERPSAAELGRLSQFADVLEVRADLIGDPDPAELRQHFDGRLLYTLRSELEGGGAEDGANRNERIARSAASYDLVDLEAERDLGGLAEKVAPEQRLVSWHGASAELTELRQRFAGMAETPARYYKLVPAAEEPADALTPLALLKSLGREDVIAFGGGEPGVWSRVLAPRLGAPVVYGAAGATPGVPGQPRLERLRCDFNLPALEPVERLFGIVGFPISHSLSPRVHNSAYRKLGLPFLYLPFQTPTFGNLWLDLVESGSLDFLGFPLGGLSVTAPFKEIALAVSGAASPLAERIGSANTLVRNRQVWEAETTDPEGVLGSLRASGISVEGRSCAVVGAGGAGRAAAFCLARAGAAVTLVNRRADRGRRVAGELEVAFAPLSEFDPRGFSALVNATPLGRAEGEELPFEPEELDAGTLVIDMTYQEDRVTALVAAARRAGLPTVDGREILLYQAIPQFLMMTGEQLPEGLGRAALSLPDGATPA